MVNMQGGSTLQRSKRDSGMELLKIFGMLLIIFGHIIRTLRLKSAAVPYSDYVIDTAAATQSARILLLHIMSYSGQFGNWMFFFCSAWFLVDSHQSKKNKITFMVMDIWVVSVIILAVSLIVNRDLVSNKAIAQSLFPTISLNNWYMTAYILLYAAHPFLNMIIEKLPQNRLFALSATLMVLYTGINFIKETFFSSRLVVWIAVYFAVAYMKKYLPVFANSRKANIKLFLTAFACNITLILITNFVGLRLSAFKVDMNHWINISSPFLIAMGAALFNLMRNVHFSSRVINYVSGLSLLIYIIHENVIVRTCLRAYIWHCVYNRFGFDHLFLIIFIYTAALFAASLVAAAVYRLTLERLVIKAADKVTPLLSKAYCKIEEKAMKKE